MTAAKSKIKSINQMWSVMQELSTKPNRNEVEEAALRVCTQFFICSDDFVQMFNECLSLIEESPALVANNDNKPNVVKEAEDNALAMVAGMEVAGLRPIQLDNNLPVHKNVQLSSDLEQQQLNEFHEMMSSMDFEDGV